jgi:hypothetical protein
MIITLRSPRGDVPVEVPRREDGTLYPYEMIYDGEGRRAYADTPWELLTTLIPGYGELASPVDQAQARIALCTRAQTLLQAALNAELGLDGCDADQKAVLLASRHEPPRVQRWTAPVPLVLVTAFYQPVGPLPAPSTAGAGQLVWLDPGDDMTLLITLHQAGIVTVAVADPDGGR